MKRIVFLVCFFAGITAPATHADSDTPGHFYLGLGASSLALDNDRIPGLPTSSPSHTSKMIGGILGYQFNRLWAAELGIATDVSNNADTDAFSINGYRFFGEKKWRPYVTAGVSGFNIDGAPDDSSEQVQVGVGVSGGLSENVELRASYQYMFTVSGESYTDKALGVSLLWHFKKPTEVAVQEAAPAPAPPSPPPPVALQRIELVVQFEFDSSAVKSFYQPQFADIAGVLRDNPELDLKIEGHTCWIGPEAYNQGLSQRRADAVKAKLIENYGISADRISTVGFGELKPIADNQTLAGRQANRRAIAVILKPVVQ